MRGHVQMPKPPQLAVNVNKMEKNSFSLKLKTYFNILKKGKIFLYVCGKNILGKINKWNLVLGDLN